MGLDDEARGNGLLLLFPNPMDGRDVPSAFHMIQEQQK